MNLTRKAPSSRATILAVAVAGVVLLLLVYFAASRSIVHPGAPAPRHPAPVVVRRLFAPDGVWNAQVPPTAQLDPNSSTLVAALTAEVRHEQVKGIGPWINIEAGSTPVAVVGPQEPPVRVQLDDPTVGWRVTLADALSKVPIPPAAKPAPGSDAMLTIWQPSTDRMWELYRARHLADGWHAAWGGAMEHVSASPGYYTRSSWSGAQTNWGASATSLPIVGGLIRFDELRAGRIDHALAMMVPSARKGAYSWPAERTDGTATTPTALPEGARLRLAPDLRLDKLHLPPFTLMMARAAQRYGMIIENQTGVAVGFEAEVPSPSGTASPPKAGLFGGVPPNELLTRFPWSHLQVLKMQLHPSSG